MVAVGVELEELEFIASSSSTVYELFMVRGHFHSKRKLAEVPSRSEYTDEIII